MIQSLLMAAGRSKSTHSVWCVVVKAINIVLLYFWCPGQLFETLLSASYTLIERQQYIHFWRESIHTVCDFVRQPIKRAPDECLQNNESVLVGAKRQIAFNFGLFKTALASHINTLFAFSDLLAPKAGWFIFQHLPKCTLRELNFLLGQIQFCLASILYAKNIILPSCGP